MLRTLQEYYDLPKMDDFKRAKYHEDIINTIVDNPEQYLADIEDMIDYFIAELDNGDFIRLVEKIKKKRIV